MTSNFAQCFGICSRPAYITRLCLDFRKTRNFMQSFPKSRESIFTMPNGGLHPSEEWGLLSHLVLCKLKLGQGILREYGLPLTEGLG